MIDIRRILFAIALSAVAPLCAAVGSDEPPANSAQVAKEEFERGRIAISRSQWERAITAFSRVVDIEPKNADGWNWLGYANRKDGKLDAAFKAYERALTIKPDHRGAHEYIGEAWLMAKKPEKAEEHLATLAKLCNSSCEEYTTLQAALVRYRQTAK